MTNQGEISEQDICTQYILPALVPSGWDVSKQVREQVYFTDGRIYVKGNQRRRGLGKKAESCDFTHISTSWMIKCYLSCVQDEIIRFAPATAKKNIYVKIITSLLFPLPPAAQKAIVEKCDRPMETIDQLEPQIKHRKQLAEDLMGTVQSEAFT